MHYKTRIFISHSSKDNIRARIIVETLRSFGFDVWYDEHSMGFGSLRQRFEEALPDCQIFMVLLSEDAINSVWVNREINAALELENNGTGMVIVPVLVQPCTLPLILSGYRWINCLPDHDIHVALGQLARFIFQTENEDGEYSAPFTNASTSQSNPNSSFSNPGDTSKSSGQSDQTKFKVGNIYAINSKQYIAEKMTFTDNEQPLTKDEDLDDQ